MGSLSDKISFQGSLGENLAARLDMPDSAPTAYAVFAHCFTCSKETHAAARVSNALTKHGIAVLRFDFTGLGGSGGDFANTNFSSNIADLLLAIDHLRRNFEAPAILIGHSLGGAAVLAVAKDVPEVRAVATINAPSSAAHVALSFGAKVAEIERDGAALVMLGGRPFTIRSDFLNDLRTQSLEDRIRDMRKALLVFHAPGDVTVGIENAAEIFGYAKHPKSFVSLDGADHLLSRKADSLYVASVLAAWASRYLPERLTPDTGAYPDDGSVIISESGRGRFLQTVSVGAHQLWADEPVAAGGNDAGLTPYDLLSAALGACTSMTLRMYAARKGLALGQITVKVRHAKVHAQDCVTCESHERRVDHFERIIDIAGGIPPELADKIVGIAGKCPVHRTLETVSAVTTSVLNGEGINSTAIPAKAPGP